MFMLQSGRKIRPVLATTTGKARRSGKGRRKWPLLDASRKRLRRAGSSKNDLKSKICSLEKTDFRDENKIKERIYYFFLYD